MLTPRMLRPHSVEIHNALPETPMESPEVIATLLNHVSFAGKMCIRDRIEDLSEAEAEVYGEEK